MHIVDSILSEYQGKPNSRQVKKCRMKSNKLELTCPQPKGLVLAEICLGFAKGSVVASALGRTKKTRKNPAAKFPMFLALEKK